MASEIDWDAALNNLQMLPNDILVLLRYKAGVILENRNSCMECGKQFKYIHFCLRAKE